MAPEVKTAKNSKLPKLPENYFEPVGKGRWPSISIWIMNLTTSDFPYIEYNLSKLKTLTNLAKDYKIRS